MTTYAEEKELIAFYNVENLFTPDPPPVHKLDPTLSGLRNWDEKRYKNKLFKIGHVFQLILEKEGILPMLIGLSEVQGQKPLEELVVSEPFISQYGVIHYDSMDERGVDVALLYDKNKIEVISSEPITYFFQIVGRNNVVYDKTRDVLHCKVKYKEIILNVFVLHLPSKREKDINQPKRNYILSQLRKKMLELHLIKGEASIICGDFNENPDEKNILDLLYDDDSNKIFFNPSEELYLNKIYSTYHLKNGLLFDQVILSDHFFKLNFPLHFVKSSVFNHHKLSIWDHKFAGRPFRTYVGSRYLGGYSDHFPIISELSTKNNKNKV